MEELLGQLAPLLAAFPLPELKDKRLFVTGATGFVGYWLLLAIHCLNRSGTGIQVQALSRDPEAFLARRPEFEHTDWLTWVRGDVRNYAFPAGRFDAIVHGAAETSPEAAASAEELRDSIIGGTRRVLEHAKTCAAKRILLLSSGTVYGEQPGLLERLPESTPFAASIPGAMDGYRDGKRTMEALALDPCNNLEVVVARCFTFVGYGLPRHLAIGQFIRDAKENPAIAVNGDGRPVRSFLYAADLAVWLLALLARGSPGEIYNVGSPDGVPLAEVASIVRESLAPDKPLAIKGTASDQTRRRYVPDIRKVEQELGLRVWTQLLEAIRLTAATGD